MRMRILLRMNLDGHDTCMTCGGTGAYSAGAACAAHGYAMCPFCRDFCPCPAGVARRAAVARDGRQMTLDDAARARREGISVAHAGFANFADSLPYDGEAAE